MTRGTDTQPARFPTPARPAAHPSPAPPLSYRYDRILRERQGFPVASSRSDSFVCTGIARANRRCWPYFSQVRDVRRTTPLPRPPLRTLANADHRPSSSAIWTVDTPSPATPYSKLISAALRRHRGGSSHLAAGLYRTLHAVRTGRPGPPPGSSATAITAGDLVRSRDSRRRHRRPDTANASTRCSPIRKTPGTTAFPAARPRTATPTITGIEP